MLALAVRCQVNEALQADEENVALVKEKLPCFLAAFETFKDAHVTYSSRLQDEVSFVRCQEQFKLVITSRRLL